MLLHHQIHSAASAISYIVRVCAMDHIVSVGGWRVPRCISVVHPLLDYCRQ
jgi:hypothetical protein